MSTISSWRRRRSLELFLSALTCLALTSPIRAESTSVRLAENFRDVVGYPLRDFGTVQDVLKRKSLSVQALIKGAVNCQDLLAIPLGAEQDYDSSQNTYNNIQVQKVQCWALSQLDRGAVVTATGPDDRLTPEIMHGIMANAERLSATGGDWLKTLTVFSGGTIECWDAERCTLSLPDAKEIPDYELYFYLIPAQGDERVVMVVQSYDGRSEFVYGVRWRETASGGEVVDIFPDMD